MQENIGYWVSKVFILLHNHRQIYMNVGIDFYITSSETKYILAHYGWYIRVKRNVVWKYLQSVFFTSALKRKGCHIDYFVVSCGVLLLGAYNYDNRERFPHYWSIWTKPPVAGGIPLTKDLECRVLVFYLLIAPTPPPPPPPPKKKKKKKEE